MRKYYSGITLFKLVGALLVLMGHVRVPALYGTYAQVAGLQQAVAFVVPCFYLVAGFLACKGWASAARPRAYVQRYLGGLVSIYVLLALLGRLTGTDYRIPYAAGAWHNGVLPLLKVYLVVGAYPALWFIPPLLLSVALCYYCQRRGQLSWAVALAVVGYGAALLLAGPLRVVQEAAAGPLAWQQWRYASLLQQTVVNYFGTALPFVLAGVLVARREAAFVAMSAWQLAGCVLATVALEFLLLNWLVPGAYSYPLVVSALPIGLGLFYGLLHLRVAGIQPYQRVMGRFSTVLYFLHPPLLELNARLLGLQAGGLQQLPVGPAFVIMLLTALQAGLVVWLLSYLTRPRMRVWVPVGAETTRV